MTRMSMLFGALFALLLTIAPAGAATPGVRAWLDRDSMQLGETVTLNVEAQAGSGAQPDFSALKQDFNLLGTQSSQQISIVNGASTSKTLWAVGLEPKHEGRIAIAPIAVGNASTAAMTLTVGAQASAAQAKANGDVFLEVAAEPLAPYVQQQVRYTVKLYYAFDLTDGNLNEPQADGIGVQRLGQDKSYVATVGVRRYHVVERHYALTPERSGIIDIPALAFRGTALDTTDPTGFFSRGRSVSARSDPVHLEVKPKPAEWTTGAWLPAASLLLKDESELPSQIHIGEPITRTIRLQAQGLAFEQLPELTLGAPDGADIYPDKADTRTRDDGEWIYGERVRKFAFVPNRAGTLTIPGMQVRWWNTQADRAENAELPAQTITVLAAAGEPGVSATPATVAPASKSTTAAASKSGAVHAATAPTSPSLRVWQGLAAVGFALWLATLALWWRWRRSSAVASQQAPPMAPVSSSAKRADFLRACALGEFAGAERALVGWARSERSDVRNLGEVAVRLGDASQRDALSDLQRTRYAGAASEGLATRLQNAFKSGFVWRDVKERRVEASPLPALYANRD